jgi:hypothetical protein
MAIPGFERIRPDATSIACRMFRVIRYRNGPSTPCLLSPDSDQTADIADGPFRANRRHGVL